MLQYLIIILDDTSVSFCQYDNKRKECHIISVDDLKKGILFAMKENLNIQFVYPEYELPQEYKDIINTIDHSNIVPSDCEEKILENADIVVLNGWDDLEAGRCRDGKTYVLRTDKARLFAKYQLLETITPLVARLNIVITDVETFVEEDFETYKNVLAALSEHIEKLYAKGKNPQLNILTDRMMLDKMNNCNAGWENITLAPDGKFYVCPAFYFASEKENFGLGKTRYSIGGPGNGLDIKNPQLYRLDHAPLCRKCDAYQCRRCVWLNRKTTYEVNTPSHEQCVMAHLERNASRELLSRIRQHGTFLPDREDIKEIDYLDPFNIKEE
ncbi:MAG: CXXX repeat peptide maturase [Prevotella sp.]|nr:CXXX repeat peptide maturase [Prevotella sp.]